jgi:hypothetical protein
MESVLHESVSKQTFVNLQRFNDAICRFDRENGGDPRSIDVDGECIPLELHYSRRLTYWVHQLDPEPSEALLLAARCQHIGRWRIPRETYPATRPGYLKWRTDLKRHHAETGSALLAEAVYPQPMIDRVRSLNLKQGLGSDPEVQTLEDALCLVTLELQLDDLIARTEHEKMIGILQKTWRKMSPAAHELALKLPLSAQASLLIAKALNQSSQT